jgi:hypothetical protein
VTAAEIQACCPDERDAVVWHGPQQEDFLSGAAPAVPQTANLAVPCGLCELRPATMQAFYGAIGSPSRLVDWCDPCASDSAPLVVAAGFSLTLLAPEPLPTYDEIVRQLDRAETESDTYLRRQYGPRGPRPQRGRYV